VSVPRLLPLLIVTPARSSLLTTTRGTGLLHVEALVEFIVQTLIHQVLTVNVCELVIMSIHNYLLGNETLKAIIMTLNN
jgi:hypothetical protein